MPVIGASNDNGKTFGNIIVLAFYNNYLLRLVGKYVLYLQTEATYVQV